MLPVIIDHLHNPTLIPNQRVTLQPSCRGGTTCVCVVDYDAASPSLSEKLLAEADMAKQKQQKQKCQSEQRRVKKSTFGLKKGFLNGSNAGKKKSGGGSRKHSGRSDVVAPKGEEVS